MGSCTSVGILLTAWGVGSLLLGTRVAFAGHQTWHLLGRILPL